MANKRKSPEQELKHLIRTRVNQAKYDELSGIINSHPGYDMSSLVRHILHNRPIRVFTKDKTLDSFMLELGRLREEIHAIGVNINQVVKKFNTYPEPQKKALFARIAFEQYQAIEPKIDSVYEIMQNLAVRWLSKSEPESRSGGRSPTMNEK